MNTISALKALLGLLAISLMAGCAGSPSSDAAPSELLGLAAEQPTFIYFYTDN